MQQHAGPKPQPLQQALLFPPVASARRNTFLAAALCACFGRAQFHRLKAENSGRSLMLSPEQQRWLTIQRILAATKLQVRGRSHQAWQSLLCAARLGCERAERNGACGVPSVWRRSTTSARSTAGRVRWPSASS